MQNNFILRILPVVVFSAVFCGFVATPASAGACDGTAEQAKITVVADWLPWAVQEPIMAAQQRGYYKDEGLEVDLISPANVADQLKMVSAGRAEFSIVEASMIMAAHEENIPITSVAVLLRPLPLGIAVRGDSNLKTVADLRGKTVGSPALPSARAMIRTALASAGLSESDVKIIDPGYAAIELLIGGKIDGAYMLEYAQPPVANDILAKDGKPPPRFLHFRDNGVPNFYYIVMAANENWTGKHPASACRFLRATTRGYESYAANPDPVIKEMAAKNEIFSLEQHTKIAQAAAEPVGGRERQGLPPGSHCLECGAEVGDEEQARNQAGTRYELFHQRLSSQIAICQKERRAMRGATMGHQRGVGTPIYRSEHAEKN